MFIFALLLVFFWLEGISVPVMQYKITTICVSLTHKYINIGWHILDILYSWLQWNWVWGLQMRSSYYAIEFQIKSWMSQLKRDNKTIEQFINASITPFQLIVFDHILISLPLPLMIFPAWTKDTNIILIHFQLTFLLPLESMLICWPPLLTPHNFLSCIIMILTLSV